MIADESTLNALFHLTSTLLWISGAFLLIRLIDAVVWQRLMVAHGYHAPRLLRQIIAALIWFWAACGVVSLVYGLSLTTLIAASTVSMGVAGFALQRPILDAFSGIVLALQRPFEIGDWLLVDEESGVGRVTEMNWRAVHLVTPNEVTLVVPNGHFTSNQAVLYSRPQQFFRDEIKVTLPYNVTTHQGQRILLGAVNQIDEIAAIPRNSIISIADYTERGILWRILYWCPDAGRVPVFRFKVHQNILRNLHYAGIEVPIPKLDLRRIPARPEQSDEFSDIDPLILHIPIFVVFTKEELRQLSTQSNNRLAHAGTPLLRQGEAGDSLFILREGMLEVRKAKEGQAETVVGRIQPGDFFGEMSLLLGEPRSATVVPIVDSMIIEISRDTMTQMMQGRPELANYLAELLAERQADSAAKIASAQIDDVEQQPQSILEQTLIRIRALFSLG
ncbi:hypothetical protein BOW53_02770 [Solemya pervernicosa gill symbiont]|uniref:Small-conductance mechanosensitive channel n=1 Tax=Solemya pervernicosa gill symbiont TaxID=642797 RepID=A0A1T2L961_9GAMM|nr:hypothetical protein BOW53_02770 [Solemya pervernicosa gill symbiont]